MGIVQVARQVVAAPEMIQTTEEPSQSLVASKA
jgi:hypothetical protein